MAAGDEKVNHAIRDAFAAGRLDGLHSVLVLHRGEVFSEVYFPGEDESWGQSHGVVQHGRETLHDLRSVTKSIIAVLYGIALGEGKVPAPSEPLYQQFPEYGELGEDPFRQQITVADVLTMRMGLRWNEDVPYLDKRNSEVAMEWADDRYRYVLEQKIVEEPGQTWRYSGGATVLLGRLIEKGTGMRLDEYAKAKLFDPLSITKVGWLGRSESEPSAASGLRLTAPGLARIGQMIAADGVWNGQQIVPKAWLAELREPKTQIPDGLRYSYQWYLSNQGDPPSWMAGLGNGGQRFTVQPQHDLVFVIFAGNYNQRDAWKVGLSVMVEFLIPALTQKTRAE